MVFINEELTGVSVGGWVKPRKMNLAIPKRVKTSQNADRLGMLRDQQYNTEWLDGLTVNIFTTNIGISWFHRWNISGKFSWMCLNFFGSLKLEAIPPIHGIYMDILNRTYVNNDVYT